MANNAQSFKAPQCEKRPQRTGAAAQKVGCNEFARIRSVPAATSIASAQSSFMRSPVRLLVSAKRAATNSTNFASVWEFSEQNSANLFESEQPSPACYGVRK
jgi:hypothetical protein